jgi:FAD/FMN-containing dehydrogenase
MNDKASRADHDYFRRIARLNATIDDDQVPASLDEMFDRLERIRQQHGSLAIPGVRHDGDGDLQSHLSFLAHQRRVLESGTHRA